MSSFRIGKAGWRFWPSKYRADAQTAQIQDRFARSNRKYHTSRKLIAHLSWSLSTSRLVSLWNYMRPYAVICGRGNHSKNGPVLKIEVRSYLEFFGTAKLWFSCWWREWQFWCLHPRLRKVMHLAASIIRMNLFFRFAN